MDKLVIFVCLCLVIFHTTKGYKGEKGDMKNQLMCISNLEFEERLLLKMGRLEHAMEMLQEKMDQQIAEMDDTSKKVKEGMSKLTSNVEEEIGVAFERIDKAKDDLIKSVNIFVDEKDAFLKKKIGSVKRTLIKALAKERPVVFSVIDPRSKLVDGVPVFQTELINEGGAYNLTTGKFTGPYDGIYSFTFIIRSSSKGYSYCRIRQNDFEKNYAISEGSNDMATVTVYLKLKSGDIVDLGLCANWDDNAGTPTSFSGYLMHRL